MKKKRFVMKCTSKSQRKLQAKVCNTKTLTADAIVSERNMKD